MSIWDEITAAARRNMDVFYEIEAVDTVLRRHLDGEQRRKKGPWTMIGRKDLADEELEVWRKLDQGTVSKAKAILEMQALMESYYGTRG